MLRRNYVDPSRLPEAAVAKWGEELLIEGFTPFPKRLLRCLSLVFQGERAMDDLAVILSVADYRRPNLARPPSIDFLAFIAGLETDSFKQRLEVLSKRSWVACEGLDAAIDVKIEPFINKVLSVSNDDLPT